MKILIVLAALAGVFLSVSCRHHGKPDFYWRDFNGSIPSDAFPVFMNDSDVPVYIGQGYFDGVGLLPGMLHAGLIEMQVSYKGNVYTIYSNIKIMCTDSARPESDFQWIRMNYDNLDSMKALQFLNIPSGGTADNHVVYIGRLPDPVYKNIGQVNTIKPYEGLNIPNPKIPRYTVFRNFELLALINFDCDEDTRRH